ncbi:MAG: TadE/TadG family type IV pilus assembly protein [Jiangellales bacterium]
MSERGSAVAEFTLVVSLLVMLVLGIAQVGMAIHVRNTVVACAAEGARLAANADRDVADGVALTQRLIASALSDAMVGDVRGRHVPSPAGLDVQIEVSTKLPMVGLAGPARSLTVTAHAVEES